MSIRLQINKKKYTYDNDNGMTSIELIMIDETVVRLMIRMMYLHWLVRVDCFSLATTGNWC